MPGRFGETIENNRFFLYTFITSLKASVAMVFTGGGPLQAGIPVTGTRLWEATKAGGE
jgi:hypothetical protein